MMNETLNIIEEKGIKYNTQEDKGLKSPRVGLLSRNIYIYIYIQNKIKMDLVILDLNWTQLFELMTLTFTDLTLK